MTHVTTPALSVGSVAIREHGGLYSLNDLHRASGSDNKHRPNYFLANEQIKSLIAEIDKAGIPAFRTTRGRYASTYACHELVIAYAAWISAAFHLKVIRVFLDTAMAQPALSAPTSTKALPPRNCRRNRSASQSKHPGRAATSKHAGGLAAGHRCAD